jgi:hypothetical protein
MLCMPPSIDIGLQAQRRIGRQSLPNETSDHARVAVGRRASFQSSQILAERVSETVWFFTDGSNLCIFSEPENVKTVKSRCHAHGFGVGVQPGRPHHKQTGHRRCRPHSVISSIQNRKSKIWRFGW